MTSLPILSVRLHGAKEGDQHGGLIWANGKESQVCCTTHLSAVLSATLRDEKNSSLSFLSISGV